jgi:hypothetical protein
MFYTTPGDDGAVAVTCDRCYAAESCPDPWAAATAITHHRCDPDPATTHPTDDGLALDGHEPPPALHLLAGWWVASCPACGFQLASARSQARCERCAACRVCPVCTEVA